MLLVEFETPKHKRKKINKLCFLKKLLSRVKPVGERLNPTMLSNCLIFLKIVGEKNS
jgi:hypothetical protein